MLSNRVHFAKQALTSFHNLLSKVIKISRSLQLRNIKYSFWDKSLFTGSFPEGSSIELPEDGTTCLKLWPQLVQFSLNKCSASQRSNWSNFSHCWIPLSSNTDNETRQIGWIWKPPKNLWTGGVSNFQPKRFCCRLTQWWFICTLGPTTFSLKPPPPTACSSKLQCQLFISFLFWTNL